MRRHLNANRGQSVLAHDMAFWDPFSQQVAQMKYIFLNWDSLHERLNSHCKAWSYKKKKRKRIKAYRKSLQKEPTVSRCLLILDLKPYPKTRTTEPSDSFLHLRETSLDTRWQIEHFRLFLFLRLLVYWTWAEDLWNFQIPQVLKERYNFTLRWLLDTGNAYLEQNLRLKTLDYLLFIPAIFLSVVWLLHG